MLHRELETERVEEHRRLIESTVTRMGDLGFLASYLGNLRQDNPDFQAFASSADFSTDKIQVVSSERVGIGKVGLVYKVALQLEPRKSIVYLKKYTDFLPGTPEWENEISSTERGERERKALEAFSSMQITGLVVPKVICWDPQEKILMTIAVDGSDNAIAVSPKTESGGESDLGRIIGTVHSKTYRPDEEVSDSDLHLVNAIWSFRTAALGSAYLNDPEFVDRARREATLSRNCLVCRNHGDLTIRNAYKQKDGQLALYDFEVSSEKGDPWSEVGFFMAHYALEATLHPEDSSIWPKAMCFWQSYLNVWQKSGLLDSEKLKVGEEKAIKYLAMTLIYRSTFSASWKVDFDVNKVIQKARIIFDQKNIADILK